VQIGYDEGGFSASVSLASFKNDFHLNASQWKNDASGLANRTANITSLGVLGAAFGSLLAVAIIDRFGRLKSWRFFLGLWATGILMQAFSTGIYALMLFARVWGGLGSGGLTVVSPLFLSEIARAQHRGLIVSIYMVTLLSFLTLGTLSPESVDHSISNKIGFFVNYGVDKHLPSTRTQYRLVQTLPLIPCALAFTCSYFLEESPRWLASKDRGENALSALIRLRGSRATSHGVESEVISIQAQVAENRRSLSNVSTIEIIKEIACVRTYRKRFILALIMQTIAQWSGGNGITYYVPEVSSMTPL
jgi:MFS family permease